MTKDDELRLALPRLKAWCEGRSNTIKTADVRRVVEALLGINRIAACVMDECAAWRKWSDGVGSILAIDGTKRRTEEDWNAVLAARERTGEWELKSEAEAERPAPTAQMMRGLRPRGDTPNPTASGA